MSEINGSSQSSQAAPISSPEPQGATQSTAPSTGSPIAEAAKEAMRRHKVKVDGQELEVDESELIRGYGHQRAANKALQEGKALRKQSEEFINMMKDEGKLFDVMKKLGHDPIKLAEQYLVAHLEDELMDPRDKELRDTKGKLKQIEDMEKMQREAVEQRRHEEMKSKHMKDYETQFVEALKVSQLPPTKPMVAEMAKYISRSAQIGFKMSPQEAAQLVKEDLQQAHMRLIGDSDGETLIRLLGEDVANKVRKWDTSRVKSPEQYLKTPPQNEEPRSVAKKSRMSQKDWREMNRK